MEAVARDDLAELDLSERVRHALADFFAALELAPRPVEVLRVAALEREGSAKLKVVRQR